MEITTSIACEWVRPMSSQGTARRKKAARVSPWLARALVTSSLNSGEAVVATRLRLITLCVCATGVMKLQEETNYDA